MTETLAGVELQASFDAMRAEVASDLMSNPGEFVRVVDAVEDPDTRQRVVADLQYLVHNYHNRGHVVSVSHTQ